MTIPAPFYLSTIPLPRPVLLTYNGRCANGSIIQALAMCPVSEEAAGRIRKVCDTLLVLRDPAQRYLSACASAEMTPALGCLMMEDSPLPMEQRHPILRPQHPRLRYHSWLVPLWGLADLFNEQGWPPLPQVNILQPCGVKRLVEPDALRVRIEALYEQDMDLLMRSRRVPLWGPKGSPRFLWGDCPTCAPLVRG